MDRIPLVSLGVTGEISKVNFLCYSQGGGGGGGGGNSLTF